jgi:MarR family transcriptional regulator, organic hydroperoxide resistance regulator
MPSFDLFSFNLEHTCSRLNEWQGGNVSADQDAPAAQGTPAQATAPWTMPRFRNWIAVGKVHVLVEKAMTAGLQPLGLKLPHYDILANVYRFPDLTQQDLANRMLVGRSNLSMLLPELEKRALIERTTDAQDKRVRRLRLTPDGHALTSRALAVQVAVIEDMMMALTAQECEQLGDFMRRVGAHLAKAAPK